MLAKKVDPSLLESIAEDVKLLLQLGGQQRLEHDAVDLCELVFRRSAFFTDLATRAGVVIATSAARRASSSKVME